LNRPLIFLGHSLGGIVIKQALINAFPIDPLKHDHTPWRDISESTKHLFFFGVPSQGIHYEELVGMVGGTHTEQIARDLQLNHEGGPSPFLDGLNNAFCVIAGETLTITCYHESKPTLIVSVINLFSGIQI
jgi:hypothetical protein